MMRLLAFSSTSFSLPINKIKTLQNMTQNSKSSNESFWNVKNFFGLLFLFGIPAYWIYLIYINNSRSKTLDGKTNKVKAVIINEKNFYGNSPVTQTFSYSYQFKIGLVDYKGDSQDPDLSIGDSILIKYSIENPDFNEPVK
ncbi:hypothetical protein [Arsenicibacter rosenii]|uniref:DUF3592 domain-containing protein n=1 Tax=Arsenicibacter rosenii TaxID=1750698 RepID=A0A1S2VB09_9BACT|nr:hypothetical protein [Arsenicibacter rosenii]OIN55914.1 hypothetical protein BLX24_27575 [Arsenicibacter rosenii]